MNEKKLFGFGCLAICVLFLLAGGCSAVFTYNTQDTLTATVTDKERIVTGAGDSTDSKYLVFTEHETLENTDTLWFFKFNSGDVQGSIHVGETYTFRVYGWRIPFLSSYRNIISAEREDI